MSGSSEPSLHSRSRFTRASPAALASLTLLLIIVVAVAARLLVFAEVKDGPLPHMRVWTQSDMSFFDGWARTIAAGDLLTRGDMRPYHGRHRRLACAALELARDPRPCDAAAVRATWDSWVGKGTFWQDPLYPYALAGLYGAFGHGVFVAYAFNVLLGLVTVALVFRIALELGGVGAGAAAGLIAALYGPLLFYETLLLREVAITCGGLATIWLTMRAAGRSSTLAWAACGSASGAFVLLKASGALFVVMIPFFMLAGARAASPPRWRSAAAFVAGLAVALAPLVARNLAVGTAPLAPASTGPLNFLNGNAADRVAGAGSAISELAAPILARTGGEPLATVRAAVASHASAWSWIALLRDKLLAFWQAREIPNNASYDYFRLQAPLFARFAVGFTLLAALAVPGLAPALRRRSQCAVLLAYVAAGIGVCVIFFNLSRFRLPVACALMPLAGCGTAAWVAAVREGRWAVAGAGAALATLVAVLVGTTAGLASSPAAIRIADYGVANEISVQLAARALAAGRADDAGALVRRQLRTEPAELVAATPAAGATRISGHLAAVAGTFVDLHRVAAEAAAAEGDGADAARHRARAAVLRTLNAPYAAAHGD